MNEVKILDACCGSRMFWFDKNETHTTFMDIRQETFTIHGKKVNVNPNVIGDFRNMPFEDNSFNLVVFDPPHLKWADCQINVKEILKAIPFYPLFEQQRGTTHWMVFVKME